jgi:hypothetical protein
MNYKNGVISDIQVASGGTGASTLTDHGILLGSGTGAITPLGVATNGQLPIGSTGADPVLATLTAGDGIDVTNAAGSISIAADLKANGGIVIETSELAVDLGASSITGTLAVSDGGTGRVTGTTAYSLIATGTTATGAQQTLANGATTEVLVGGGASALPVWGTNIPTAVTIGTKYIYRAGGTDVPVTDGGTGASTLTDHGVLLGSGTGAITPMTALAAGEIIVGVGGADPHALAAGATTTILVGGGAADPVWTEATGSGAPVRATAPTIASPSYTGTFGFAPATELTIATGAITAAQTIHLVDTESDAATDDLVTINGGADGLQLEIRAAHADRTVVIKETGNILTGGSDIRLDDTNKYILFTYDGALSKWVVVGGSGSGGGGFATAAEITTGTEAAKAIAPDQLKLAGIIPANYATAAEITTGTEAAKAIAPDQLKLAGIIPANYATAAEITTGTEAAKAIAPDQLAVSGIYKETGRLCNVGIAATVSGKALTIALKGENGNDPSTSNIVSALFRSATLTTGTPNLRTFTAATSFVLSSGSTLGFTANESGRIYFGEIDSDGAGTMKPCASRIATAFNEGGLATTVAEDGAGGSDSATALYSDAVYTDKPARIFAYIEITTGAVAGEWDNAPTKIQIMGPGVHRTGDIVQEVSTSTTTSGTTASVIPWDNTKPQISEGAALLSRTITPTSILNKLVIDSNIPLIDASGTIVCTLALFKNSDADALTTGVGVVQASSIGLQLAIHYEMTAGSVSELIFSTRVGPHSGTMAWLRGYTSGDVLNGTLTAYLRAKEVFA